MTVSNSGYFLLHIMCMYNNNMQNNFKITRYIILFFPNPLQVITILFISLLTDNQVVGGLFVHIYYFEMDYWFRLALISPNILVL